MTPTGRNESDPIPRPTARVIAIDPTERVLLLRGRGAFVDGIWFMPGGGLRPGESHAAAARRELYEETSYRVAALGPCVWTRTHAWATATGVWYRSEERFFVARTAAFDPVFADPDDPERASITTARWWSQAEISASDQVFAPRALAGRLGPILRGELPPSPIDVGI